MSKTYLSAADLAALQPDSRGVQPALAYTMRGPLPQMLLVTTGRRVPEAGPCVRTVIMTPLSWTPYTMAVSLPLDDRELVANLHAGNAQCVLAEPTRLMARQVAICRQKLPCGLSNAGIARLTLMRSQYVDVPSIADCLVNMECRVEHLETYHNHLIAFVRVVGASIDSSILFLTRDQVAGQFPTYDVDAVSDASGWVVQRIGLMGDLFVCPTFPCAPKKGWYGTFDIWMKDLCDEGYLTDAEYETAIAWHKRWQEVFGDGASGERAPLKARLTELCRLIANEQWDVVHSFLQVRTLRAHPPTPSQGREAGDGVVM